MPKYAVRAIDVTEHWATVEADSAEQARHLVLVAWSMAEELAEDDVDTVDWKFPEPMDTLAAWIDEVREVKEP